MIETLFITTSKFEKLIRLTKAIWYNKILAEHPEFKQREEYLEEIRKAVENPEYIVRGWAGEIIWKRG